MKRTKRKAKFTRRVRDMLDRPGGRWVVALISSLDFSWTAKRMIWVTYRNGVWFHRDRFGTMVDDDAVNELRAKVCAEEGLHMCPEGVACLVALGMERQSGRVGPNDRVVVFNSASGLKFPMPPMTQGLDKDQAVDYSALSINAR